ncbi:hypothetical protein BGZ95_002193 [Linnemannia exigua]|uniref:HAD-like protein n=1 Tax=Linnemannia exigua TaxID=604196 RepID=A0AAD4H3I9_9FUNG|nr:hypothetical protein BGZ95_002193 [Linnemannia exigua]
MTFSTAPPETNYPQTMPRAIFLDSGGVINDNDRRAPQWVQHLMQYMPTTKLGGPGRLWGKGNTIMSDRLFKGENPLWKQLIDRAKDFRQFYREYHLFWVQEGVRLVNNFLKEEYDVQQQQQQGDDSNSNERLPLLQLVLPESEEEQIQIAYDAHLYCTSIVRADYPGAVEAILALRLDQGFTMYTCSGESAPELELTLKTLGMSTLLAKEKEEGEKKKDGFLPTTHPTATDISFEEAAGVVIKPVFTKLYGPDLIQCHKGSSEFYRRIFEDSGVDPRDAVVVDDKEYILAWAKVHGARTVLISTRDRRGKEMTIEVDQMQVGGTVVKVVVPVVD